MTSRSHGNEDGMTSRSRKRIKMNEIQELKALMKTRGITTDIVARISEVSWQTVNRWLKGKNEPSCIYRKQLRKAIDKIKGLDL